MTHRSQTLILAGALAFGLPFLFSSCEKDPSGPQDQILGSPFLLSASLKPSALHLDTDTTGSVIPEGPGLYRITLMAEAIALGKATLGPYRAFSEVFLPGAQDAVHRQEISVSDGGGDTLFLEGTISFTLPRADAGNLRIGFELRPSVGLPSNRLQKTLLVGRNNSRPVLGEIVMPASVTVGALPSPDSTFLVSVAVADSDGLGDVSNMRFFSMKPDSTFANCGSPIPLFDDGSEQVVFPPDFLSGDIVAGDGIFSIRVLLVTWSLNRCPPPDTVYTQRGIYTFTFIATDTYGSSDTLSRTILVR